MLALNSNSYTSCWFIYTPSKHTYVCLVPAFFAYLTKLHPTIASHTEDKPYSYLKLPIQLLPFGALSPKAFSC
jgi:hypothetical protein